MRKRVPRYHVCSRCLNNFVGWAPHAHQSTAKEYSFNENGGHGVPTLHINALLEAPLTHITEYFFYLSC